MTSTGGFGYGVIFDLDQTLIESERAKPLRNARRWADVYKLIPELRPYDGITELIFKLNHCRIPVSIVTSSPSLYCHRIIQYWKWKIDVTVCYHDTHYKKPNPEPILLAIQKLNVSNSSVVAIGDDAKDIIAAKKADVLSVAAVWGSSNKKELLDSKPDKVLESVNDLRGFLIEYYQL